MTTTESTRTAGLCATCNNSPTCFYRARRGPALMCELFDDYVPPAAGASATGGSSPPGLASVSGVAAEDVSKYAGLCINCEHRRTCTHPRPPGGVWHCEDYE